VAVIQREVRALNNPQLNFLEQDRDYLFE